MIFAVPLWAQLPENSPNAFTHPVIPNPKKVNYGPTYLSLDSFYMVEGKFGAEQEKLRQFFLSKGLTENKTGTPIRLTSDQAIKTNAAAYSLTIDSQITIRAHSAQGVFYGVQSLKQLFRQDHAAAYVPLVNITDWPTFGIRGFMHDTGRNYQPLAQLKAQIEVMAQYKYNVFHWHLTDNPGWRLESKRYPQLQADSAFGRNPGKYYTQKDFLELLDFCAQRHITLIPEFDIPGHTQAFRKAFGFKSMKDPKVLPILHSLFEELTELADPQHMPYIHMGTDEARHSSEKMSTKALETIANDLSAKGHQVITWREGIEITPHKKPINQLWAQFEPKAGVPFIDSRSNYINHLDPLAGMVRLFYQQPCRQPQGDNTALGGILCAWPDNAVAKPEDILLQNPIYPSMLFYADAIWNGRDKDRKNLWAKLPPPHSVELKKFQDFETQLLLHRNLFFEKKPFPYVAQTQIKWRLLGPFDHQGNPETEFAVEQILKPTYQSNDKTYTWSEAVVGGSIHLKHFFGFPAHTEVQEGTYYAYTQIYAPEERLQDFWIGFHGWSRSGGRRGGPSPEQGKWHHTDPKIWVNGSPIAPPYWKNPDLAVNTPETPFTNEDYFYREPTQILLRKGWNQVLIKVPHTKQSWKWMFTCVPIEQTPTGVREAKGLLFNSNID